MQQGQRLMLPALELAMILNALGQSPVFKLRDVHLKLVEQQLAILEAVPDAQRGTWGSGGFYDGVLPCSTALLRPDSHT